MIRHHIIFSILVLACLSSCSKDDLAFDIIESPVLAQFETLSDGAPDMLKVKALFYDLDKSGILDNNVGIDTIPIAGLAIKVFVFETDLIQELTTEADGSVIFEHDFSALQGAGRLEWVGSYEETSFRIYQNY